MDWSHLALTFSLCLHFHAVTVVVIARLRKSILFSLRLLSLSTIKPSHRHVSQSSSQCKLRRARTKWRLITSTRQINKQWQFPLFISSCLKKVISVCRLFGFWWVGEAEVVNWFVVKRKRARLMMKTMNSSYLRYVRGMSEPIAHTKEKRFVFYYCVVVYTLRSVCLMKFPSSKKICVCIHLLWNFFCCSSDRTFSSLSL